MELNPILLFFFITLFIQNTKNQETTENKNIIEIELYSNSTQTFKYIHLNSDDKVDMYINNGIQDEFKNTIDLKINEKISIKLIFPNDYKIRCENLFKEIKVIKKIKFNNFNLCKNMYSMFYGCSSLQSLNLSTFDTSEVKYMYSMF